MKLCCADSSNQYRADSSNQLVGGRFDSLGIQVLELTGCDLTLRNERIDLTLLQPDYSAEPVRGQLPLIDQSIERARREAQGRSRLFRGQPVTVCRSHGVHANTLSTPLSHFRESSGGRI